MPVSWSRSTEVRNSEEDVILREVSGRPRVMEVVPPVSLRQERQWHRTYGVSWWVETSGMACAGDIVSGEIAANKDIGPMHTFIAGGPASS